MEEVDEFLKQMETEQTSSIKTTTTNSNNVGLADTDFNTAELDALLNEHDNSQEVKKSTINDSKEEKNKEGIKKEDKEGNEKESKKEKINEEQNNDHLLAQLMQMGYEPSIAQFALSQNDFNLERALQFLSLQQDALQQPPEISFEEKKNVGNETQKVIGEKFSQFTSQAGMFFKSTIPIIQKTIQNATSTLNTNIKDNVSNTPVPNMTPEPNQKLSLDTYKSPMEGVQNPMFIKSPVGDERNNYEIDLESFRKELFDKEPKSSKELYRFYVSACQANQIVPFKPLLLQLLNAAKSKRKVLILNVSNGNFTQKHIEIISDLILYARDLQKFIMEYTDLSDEGLKLILKALLILDTCKSLNFSHNFQLKPLGIKYIALYLKQSKNLKYLNLSGLNVDLASISTLAHGCMASLTSELKPSLEILIMDQLSLNQEMLSELATALKNISSLHTLSLKQIQLQNQDVMSLYPLLIESTSLVRLDLSGNMLTSTGLQWLLNGIGEGKGLKELVLCANRLEPLSLEILTPFLNLRYLDLSYNAQLCSDIECMTIFKTALMKNKTLKTLLLTGSGMHSDTAILLAESLIESGLECLNILDNDTAVNPLKANDLAQNVLAFGQKTLKGLSRNMNQAFNFIQDSLKKEPLEKRRSSKELIEIEKSPILNVNVPTAVELAYSALLAFLVSMRHNHTIVSLEIIPVEDWKHLIPRNPMEKHILEVLEEIVVICERNAKKLSKQENQQEEGEQVNRLKVELDLDVSKQISKALLDMIKGTTSLNQPVTPDSPKNDSLSSPSSSSVQSPKSEWTLEEKEVMSSYHEKLVKFIELFESYLTLPIVVRNELLTNQLLQRQNEIYGVLQLYKQRVSVDELLKNNGKAAFSLDDDDDEEQNTN